MNQADTAVCGPPETTGKREADAELRARVLAHISRYPDLTAFEIARALGLRTPNGFSRKAVFRQLTVLEAGCMAVRKLVPRHPGDCRPSITWSPAAEPQENPPGRVPRPIGGHP